MKKKYVRFFRENEGDLGFIPMADPETATGPCGNLCKDCDGLNECEKSPLKTGIELPKEEATKCGELDETCPENSKAVSGSCARLDANGNPGAKIPGRCDVGYTFDASAPGSTNGKCIRNPKA